MRRILTLLTSLMIAASSSNIVIACGKDDTTDNNNNNNDTKHKVTKANLDTFFAKYNHFSYEGESFFKDQSLQTKNENILNLASSVLDQIISDGLKEHFTDYFSLDSSKENYWFKIHSTPGEGYDNFWDVSKFDLTHIYKYKFQISIHKLEQNESNYLYMSNDLTFNFHETRQYNPDQWFKKYNEFLRKNSFNMFNHTLFGSPFTTGFDHTIPTYANIKEYKKNYNPNNPDSLDVLNNLNEDVKKNFTDTGFQYHFYNDKKMIITKINSYQYVTTICLNNIFKIIEKINLTVAYANPDLLKDIAPETFNLNISCQFQ